MTADETDPTSDEPSAAPPQDPSPAGDADPAPAAVESEELASLLADPEIAPARDDAELARLLATPEAAAPAEETPGLAAILADPDPAVFGEPAPEAGSGTEPSPDTALATGHPRAPEATATRAWDSRRDAKPPRADPTHAGVNPAHDVDPVPPTGLALPALPPERPGPPPSAETGRGGYLGLVALVFLLLAVLLVGAVVLIAVLVSNGAWPFPAAAALSGGLPLL